MKVNFYKTQGINIKNAKLVTKAILDYIPQKGLYIKFFEQEFVVNRVYYDITKDECNVYMSRA